MSPLDQSSLTLLVVDMASGGYHEGSIAVQERTGERQVAIPRGAMIRESLPAAAREFLATQRAVAVATVDAQGRPWASFWLGPAGFATSEDGEVLRLVHDREVVSQHDPILPLLVPGANAGALAIDLGTRRRLRINGVIAGVTTQAGAAALAIRVNEVFGNCPKYIQQREWLAAGPVPDPRPVAHGVQLDTARRSLVASVDTLFVASRHPGHGVDVSHRGGNRGFVQTLDERTLRIPDYRGNSMFQTLGNFEIDPRAGLILVDFDGHRFLSLTGRVETVYGRETPGHPSGGTGRYWTVAVERWVEFPMPGSAHFRLVEVSPHNPPAFAPTD